MCALIAAVSLTFFVSGCGGGRIVELKKEHLFSIPIGQDQEEIGVLRESNGRFVGPAHVLFRNGFFFTVDTVNQKILKITTPGDVILTINDGEMENSDFEENLLRTKQTRYFDFTQIGHICVDTENNLYVEDVFLQRQEVESVIDIFSIDDGSLDEGGDYEEIYKSYIIKFDRLGSYVHRIGQDGVGTEPFYYLYSIDIDRDGNLIAITGDDGWQHWTYRRFSPAGEKVEEIELDSEDIESNPVTEDRVSFIMDIVPTSNPGEVVYWLSHYETTQDTKEVIKEEDLWGEEIEIEDYDRFRQRKRSEEEEREQRAEAYRDLLSYDLIFYDLETRSVGNVHTWEVNMGNEVETTEEFIGLDNSLNCFFWKYIDRNKSVITIVRPDGTFLTKRSFIFEDDGIWLSLQIAPDGSVSAVKVDQWNVHFYRWRSDRLITNKHEKLSVREFIAEKVEEFKNANR
jgi:hypothetical protein